MSFIFDVDLGAKQKQCQALTDWYLDHMISPPLNHHFASKGVGIDVDWCALPEAGSNTKVNQVTLAPC